MSSRGQTLLKRGIVGGLLGIAAVMVSSGQVWSNPQPEEASLWTFSVDQCTDDGLAPRVQQIQRSPQEEAVQGGTDAEKVCRVKRSHFVYQVFPKPGSGEALLAGRSLPARESGRESVEAAPAVESVDITQQNRWVTDLQVQALPGQVQFQYIRSTNCCSYIELVPEQRGQVLEVREWTLPASSVCRCVCPRNVEGTMNDLEPGVYTLRVLGSQYVDDREQEVVLFAGTITVL